MKLIYLLAFVVIVAIIFALFQKNAVDKLNVPDISFFPMEILDSVKMGDKSVQVISVLNNGNEDVVFKEITTECSCTKVYYVPKILKPLDTLLVTLEFTPYATGVFNKVTGFLSNRGGGPHYFNASYYVTK